MSENIPTLSNKPIMEQVQEKLDDLFTLSIRTQVTGQENKEILTEIDLLDGDITTSISREFLTDEVLMPLKDFHLDREKQGGEIIKGNIEALKSIVDLAKELTTG